MGTVYIAYALAIRNKAIATSQSELISNTVIVLLVSMIDDELFKLIDDNNPSWFKEIMNRNEGENSEENKEQESEAVEGKREGEGEGEGEEEEEQGGVTEE